MAFCVPCGYARVSTVTATLMGLSVEDYQDLPTTGAALPSDDLAAPVVDSPAARPTRKPFRLHKVKPKAKRR